MISKEQRDEFLTNGFLIIPSFMSNQEILNLRREAQRLIDSFGNEPIVAFNTDKSQKRDEYFIGSADKIRYFMEPKSVDHDKLNTNVERAINKIGHYLHEKSSVFKEFSLQSKIQEIAKSLGFKSPVILQSMVIFKQPGIGNEVPPHIDSTFLYTDPPSAVGFWFALEDCTLENGCMHFAPKSHKLPVASRFVRNEEGNATSFIKLKDIEMPSPEEYVACPCSAGSLVLIHGSCYHKSGHNLSAKSRWIYTFHCIEGDYHYPKDNWLQPGEKPFTKLYQ